MLVGAFTYACAIIMARQLQKVSFATIMFYEGLFATQTLMCVILFQGFVGQQEIQLLTYSAEQYFWALLPVVVNFISVGSGIIAAQNERSGFITLLAQISLAYGFFADLVVFHDKPSKFETIGVLTLLAINIVIACEKWNPATPPA